MASLTIVSGGMQGAFVSTVFANPVVVQVRDNSGVPQAGVTVSSIVPGAGAGATTAASAISNGSGNASFTLTANSTTGQYSVGFSTSGATDSYSLFRNSAASSTSQTKVPTVRTQQATGPYTAIWSNPGFLSSTGTTDYASVTCTSALPSQILKGSSFGFTLPTDATVTGYLFDIHIGYSGTYNSQLMTLILAADGSDPLSSPLTVSDAPSAWRAHYTVGGAGDLWGVTALTPTQINSDNFTAAVIEVPSTGGSSILYANELSVTVYYDLAPLLPIAPAAAALAFCAN